MGIELTQHSPETTEDGAVHPEAPNRGRARRPYVKPRVADGEPLVNVTLLSGGANPSSQTPFVP